MLSLINNGALTLISMETGNETQKLNCISGYMLGLIYRILKKIALHKDIAHFEILST